jgi:hypothetical protein
MLNQTPGPSREPNISLTLVGSSDGKTPSAFRVPAAQLISYVQQDGFTRLRLTGGRVLEVKESTDQIDRLVRGIDGNLARQ